MREQHGLYPPLRRRASATPEELAVRRTGGYPPATTHRAGHYIGLHPEDEPYWTGQVTPQQQSRLRPTETDEEQLERVRERSHTSAVRHRPVETINLQEQRRIRFHWLLFVGIALFIMIVGWMCLTLLGQWWQGVQDNWKYGMPRTFQTDQYVGHGDSPDHPDHFIALNLHGLIEIVEINPEHPEKDHIYTITKITDGDSTPVSISFQEVNGKQEMQVSIGDSNPYTVILLNSGTSFQPNHWRERQQCRSHVEEIYGHFPNTRSAATGHSS